MATTTRERLVTAGGDLFRQKGYTGTGVKEILAAARAPFGSMYHHFPGGKEELGAEAVRVSGALYGQAVGAVLAGFEDPVEGTRESFRLAGVHLEESGWQDACPIATVALEASSTSEPLRIACAEVFEAWTEALTAYLGSRPLAVAFLSQLEGAFVLARAQRSTEPLDVAGELMADAVRRA